MTHFDVYIEIKEDGSLEIFFHYDGFKKTLNFPKEFEEKIYFSVGADKLEIHI